MKQLSRGFPKAVERLFIWLSGADHQLLGECPRYEQIKYSAFGASVLVPTIFGAIAACYAVSTLTDNTLFIYGFAAVWGLIILTVDRLLLSTYRAFASKRLRKAQFFLRTTIVVLMGFTISHPLTLFLFEDAITSEIEKHRSQDIVEMRAASEEQRQSINNRVTEGNRKHAGLQKDYQSIVAGTFLRAPKKSASSESKPGIQVDEFDQQIASYKAEQQVLRDDLAKWQSIYEDEISGKRTGVAGIGPNARAIESKEISWRRIELMRLKEQIKKISTQRSELNTRFAESRMQKEMALADQYSELEAQSIRLFSSQQDELLAGVTRQIALVSNQVETATQELVGFDNQLNQRIESVQSEQRTGLMYRSLALHDLFKNKSEGGGFALAVYAILIGLFVVIDTTPLVVKFFSEPGVYDKKLTQDESLVFNTPFCDAVVSKRDVMYQLSNYQPGATAAVEPVSEEEVVVCEDLQPEPSDAVEQEEEQLPFAERRRLREQRKIAKKRVLKDRLKSYRTTDRDVSVEMEHDTSS